ncbi:MAG: hypothetical protein K2X66_13660 [Cyanobacteria bacterium]|nr:hypothetical protein [Cyanobacteriota bacterium]
MAPKKIAGLLFLLMLGTAAFVPSFGKQTYSDNPFPSDGFVPTNPALPNSELNFKDDTNQSCCMRDYGKSKNGEKSDGQAMLSIYEPYKPSNSDPSYLYECAAYAQLSELVSNENEFPNLSTVTPTKNRTVYSDTNNMSKKQFAGFFIQPDGSKTLPQTSSFHIGAEGGMSMVSLKDVAQYSVCMARGGNVVAIADTNDGSIMTYNGNDHIYLSGNNTNMLTRTGGGEDLIEVHQAQAVALAPGESGFRGENWTAYNVYNTALSGSDGEDTLVIKDTPMGTKWCNLGGYNMFGEYFNVVEFALPPSVTKGPTRQRLNIGASVEYVVYQGRRYTLREFLSHGHPVDQMARAIPIGSPLPYVSNK